MRVHSNNNHMDDDELHITGALKSDDDSSDWIYEHLVRAPNGEFFNELPAEFSLIDFAQRPRTQGNRGTCGAIVAATVQEIHINKLSLVVKQADISTGLDYMSPEFIYFHRVNKPNEGMFGRNVFQILQKVGNVPEGMFPYGNADIPDEKLYVNASKYKILNFARVQTIDGLKQALIELGACYMGLPLYNFTEKFWDPLYGRKIIGGHAICIIGYNKDGFIFRNSWGECWGDNGNGLFPYSDFGLHWEIWTPIGLHQNVDAKLISSRRRSVA